VGNPAFEKLIFISYFEVGEFEIEA